MQGELFSYCYQCGCEHPAVATIEHTIHRGHNRKSVYHFCSENCQRLFALGQMRRLEGTYVPEV